MGTTITDLLMEAHLLLPASPKVGEGDSRKSGTSRSSDREIRRYTGAKMGLNE